MRIRLATDDDWPAIWPFMRQLVRAGETFAWHTDLDEARARDRWFASAPARTFVAVDDAGELLGTAVTGPNHEGPAAHIATASFMVDPAHAGKGVGRQLCEHVLEDARAAEFRGMQFNAVVSTNTPAVALWTSLGFEVVATIPGAFHHPRHGYVGLHIMFQSFT